jgi:hypothetical protein
MALYSGYGDSTVLHSGDALIVHRSQDPRVLIIEYEVHGMFSRPIALHRSPSNLTRDNHFIDGAEGSFTQNIAATVGAVYA